MFSAEDVVGMYTLLSSHGILVWLTGGWGIDALLGIQTRPHHDMDVIMLVDDVSRLCELLIGQGYTYKELWEENLWTEDASGNRVETAFFLRDPDGREFDVHACRMEERGYGIPAWEKPEGFVFTPQYLSGEGRVAGLLVRCMSAQFQMVSHIGYPLPGKQVPDLEKLHEKYGVEFPVEIARQIIR